MRYRVPYLLFCATVIALLVFLNSEQSFVLSQIIKVKLSLIGFVSGNLALVDETVSLIASPFWGALSDKVGTRHVSVLGLLFISLGLFLYPRVPTFPFLVASRAIFALGASASVSMMTASLSELSVLSLEQNLRILERDTLYLNPQFQYSSEDISTISEGDHTVPLFEESTQIADEPFNAVLSAPRPNGRLAGYVGLFSGFGAIFSVSVLLPLPTFFGDGTHGLVTAFTIVALCSMAASLLFFFLLYQNPTRSWRSFFSGNSDISVFDEAAVDIEGTVMTYFELMKEGWLTAKNDRRVALGYTGSLCARATSVCLTLFIPMWVNNWYYDNGLCHQYDKEGCKPAIVKAAIITGIANTVMLIFAPVVGYTIDKYGAISQMCVSVFFGMGGVLGMCLINTVHGFWPILFASFIATSQIGITTTSLSLTTDQRRVASGAVSGWYSFAGSLGIIFITLFGGFSFYIWDKFPFLCLGFVLIVLTLSIFVLSPNIRRPKHQHSSLSLR